MPKEKPTLIFLNADNQQHVVEKIAGLPLEDMAHIHLWRNEDGSIEECSEGQLSFELACTTGLLNRVRECIKEEDEDVNQSWDGGHSPLSVAVTCGHVEVVQLLAEEGVELDQPFYLEQASLKGSGPMTALFLACRQGHVKLVDYLLRQGCKPDQRVKAGGHPLLIASGCGEDACAIIDLLVNAGATVNLAADDGCTAIMLAVHSGALDATEALISHGADVNALMPTGRSSLHFAAMLQESIGPSIIRTLLAAGACDIYGRFDGKTPYDWAIQLENTSSAMVLRQAARKQGAAGKRACEATGGRGREQQREAQVDRRPSLDSTASDVTSSSAESDPPARGHVSPPPPSVGVSLSQEQAAMGVADAKAREKAERDKAKARARKSSQKKNRKAALAQAEAAAMAAREEAEAMEAAEREAKEAAEKAKELEGEAEMDEEAGVGEKAEVGAEAEEVEDAGEAEGVVSTKGDANADAEAAAHTAEAQGNVLAVQVEAEAKANADKMERNLRRLRRMSAVVAIQTMFRGRKARQRVRKLREARLLGANEPRPMPENMSAASGPMVLTQRVGGLMTVPIVLVKTN